MEKINITEKYALFILKEKSKLYTSEFSPYLCVSMIVEMMLDENIEITEKNKIVLTNKMPTDKYKLELYNAIKEEMQEKEEKNKKDKTINLKDFISNMCYGFSDKKIKEIINLLKEKMLNDNLIEIGEKDTLFGAKENISVKEEKFDLLNEEIRNAFLKNGELTEELILLASLLKGTRFIKNIFTKYEKEEMEKKLKEIANTEIAQKVKIAQDAIDEMLVALIILIN